MILNVYRVFFNKCTISPSLLKLLAKLLCTLLKGNHQSRAELVAKWHFKKRNKKESINDLDVMDFVVVLMPSGIKFYKWGVFCCFHVALMTLK